MRSAVTASAGTARALQPALASACASSSADSVSISLRAPMHNTLPAPGEGVSFSGAAGWLARKSSSSRLTPLTTRCRCAAVARSDDGRAASASIGTALSL